MNKNFHYAAIKAMASHAGFPEPEAQTIAYASQYVDDASRHEPLNVDRDPGVPGVRYDCGEFDPICTAHGELDYLTNLTNVRAHLLVYVCFHFIPGRQGSPGTPAWNQVLPGNDLARKLVTDALDDLRSRGDDRTPGLIRLGVALHSYADTWAHQGFSGQLERASNDISDLRICEGGVWRNVDVVSRFLAYAAPDLGHAEAGTLPDRSEMTWECKPCKLTPARDNLKVFLDASRDIFSLLESATDKAGKWGELRRRLQRCLISPVSEKDCRTADCWRGSSWEKEFGKGFFRYDDREWFRAALEPVGGILDVLGDFTGLDARDYKVLKDPRYFHFHAAAGRQREYVKAVVKSA